MTGPVEPLRESVDRSVATLLERFPDPRADVVEFLGARFDLGLAWVHFAPGRGGLGAPREWQREIDHRLRAAGAPDSLGDFVALHQVAAILENLGGPDLHNRFLRRIYTGEEHWCQLFSEPGAGSDLANIGTLAVRDGYHWVANGQKVWTSGARDADYALLLARTDPTEVKHRGMTMFVLDMHDPGVEVRPLRQADGGARFSEVFLSGVRLDDAMRIGEVGAGWAVSLRVLGTERDGAADVFHRPIDELLAAWRDRKEHLPDSLRDLVTQLWIESRVIELCKERRRAAPDSPDTARLAGIFKIVTSAHAQRLGDVTATVLGPEVLLGIDYDAAMAADMSGEPKSPNRFASMPPGPFLLRSRAMSIEGGTNEIQRNILGERILGLPPDIRVDKDRPWREQVKA